MRDIAGDAMDSTQDDPSHFGGPRTLRHFDCCLRCVPQIKLGERVLKGIPTMKISHSLPASNCFLDVIKIAGNECEIFMVGIP